MLKINSLLIAAVGLLAMLSHMPSGDAAPMEDLSRSPSSPPHYDLITAGTIDIPHNIPPPPYFPSPPPSYQRTQNASPRFITRMPGGLPGAALHSYSQFPTGSSEDTVNLNL